MSWTKWQKLKFLVIYVEYIQNGGIDGADDVHVLDFVARVHTTPYIRPGGRKLQKYIDYVKVH